MKVKKTEINYKLLRTDLIKEYLDYFGGKGEGG